MLAALESGVLTPQHRVFWSSNYEMTAARVVIATEATVRRHALIAQEIVQTLGPSNDSPEFPSSLFYEADERWSSATRLAPIDRKLLRFLYAHLEPGDNTEDVRHAFDVHWKVTCTGRIDVTPGK